MSRLHRLILWFAILFTVMLFAPPLINGQFPPDSSLIVPLIAGLVYGFTTFVSTVEAGTVWMGLPFSVLLVGYGAWRGRGQWREQPLLAFAWISYLVSLLLLVAWGIYWRGFPQFSEIGIIE